MIQTHGLCECACAYTGLFVISMLMPSAGNFISDFVCGTMCSDGFVLFAMLCNLQQYSQCNSELVRYPHTVSIRGVKNNDFFTILDIHVVAKLKSPFQICYDFEQYCVLYTKVVVALLQNFQAHHQGLWSYPILIYSCLPHREGNLCGDCPLGESSYA